jgi:radical SAM protein with 4Fe4S-binding SPASM domain
MMKNSLNKNELSKFSMIKKERFSSKFANLKYKFDNIVHYLTWRCNSRCTTCGCWKVSSSEKDREVWNVKNIEKLYSSLNVKRVYLTGGEPTLYDNFKEIVAAIYKNSSADVSFSTNAVLKTKIKEDVIWLKKNRIPFHVGLSCNGFKEIHDYSRGIKGNYDNVKYLIGFFKKNKINFSLVYTLFPFNMDIAFNFIKYWKDQRVNVVLNIGRYDDRYKIFNNTQEYAGFANKHYLQLENTLFSLIKLNVKYINYYYLVKEKNKGRYFFPCFGLQKRIVIAPYGDVYPCDLLLDKLKLGNLKKNNYIFDLLKKNEYFNFKRVHKIIRDRGCQPCESICDLAYAIRFSFPKNEMLTLTKIIIQEFLKTYLLKYRLCK